MACLHWWRPIIVGGGSTKRAASTRRPQRTQVFAVATTAATLRGAERPRRPGRWHTSNATLVRILPTWHLGHQWRRPTLGWLEAGRWHTARAWWRQCQATAITG